MNDISQWKFLYSQDLSNYKTKADIQQSAARFLYSQDLSNYKTIWTKLISTI